MLKRKLAFCLTTLTFLFLSISSHAAIVKSDFVFMIDATGSMAGEIAGVKNGFSQFVSNLDSEGIDARYSIILFGGAPELVLDFTGNASDAQDAFDNITIGANPGFQNNHNLNPEAGLEAVRIALGEASNNTLVRDNVGGSGGLSYRNDARKNLILVTDEDSDRPFYAENHFGGSIFGDTSPNGFDQNWQDEVDATAQAVINNDAFINMLINIGDFPTKQQYGDHTKDVSDPDFLNFDSAATLAALLADPDTANSLQAQVLQAGLIGRSFDVAGANDSDFVDNFFDAKIEETIDNPPPPPVETPEPSTIFLMGMGLIGLFMTRRGRK